MSINPASAPTLQVARLRRVREITGLCRSTIYKLEADERFPKHVKLGPRAVGWIEHEIQGWLAARIANSRQGNTR